ncbi:MAG: HAMP domain-containing histidine kinase [Flavobacteriales bacterium]|nr:HAMP domain-containing histidine kinase [Flavobacteriales bacterium]
MLHNVYIVLFFLASNILWANEKDKVNVFYQAGKFDKAMEVVFKELERTDIEPSDAYFFLNVLGEIHRTKEDFPKALKYLKQSQKFIDNRRNQVHFHNRIGAVYYQWAFCDVEKTEKAFQYLYKSIEESDGAFLEMELNSWNLIATLESQVNNNHSKSINIFAKAIEQALLNNFIDIETQLLINSTTPLTAMEKWQKAEHNLCKALSISNTLKIPIYQLTIYQKLSNIYQAIGNDILQVQSLRREIDYTYQIFDTKKIALEKKLEKVFQVHKKEKENAKLLVENKFKSWIIAVSVLVLFVFMILIARVIKLKNKLSIKNKALEESDTLNKKIFTIISHDLKSPMMSLESMIFLLDENWIGKQEIAQYKKELSIKISQAKSFIDDLLLWSYSEINQEVILEQLEISKIIEQIEQLYKESLVENRQKILYTQKTTEIPVGHRMLIFLVLKNLILNAINYAEKNSTINVLTEESKEGRSIISVKSTGESISPEISKKIFDLSRAIDLDKVTSNGGYGIGLNILSRLLDKHGAKIWIDDSFSKGVLVKFEVC